MDEYVIKVKHERRGSRLNNVRSIWILPQNPTFVDRSVTVSFVLREPDVKR